MSCQSVNSTRRQLFYTHHCKSRLKATGPICGLMPPTSRLAGAAGLSQWPPLSPTAKGQVKELDAPDEDTGRGRGSAGAAAHLSPPGTVTRMAPIVWLRASLDDGTMINYRTSRKAPVMRCYVDADRTEHAEVDALLWRLAATKIARYQAKTAVTLGQFVLHGRGCLDQQFVTDSADGQGTNHPTIAPII